MQPQSGWCSPAYYIRSRTDGYRYTDCQPRRAYYDGHSMTGDQGRILGETAGRQMQRDESAPTTGGGSKRLAHVSIAPEEGKWTDQRAEEAGMMMVCGTVAMDGEWMDEWDGGWLDRTQTGSPGRMLGRPG